MHVSTYLSMMIDREIIVRTVISKPDLPRNEHSEWMFLHICTTQGSLEPRHR